MNLLSQELQLALDAQQTLKAHLKVNHSTRALALNPQCLGNLRPSLASVWTHWHGLPGGFGAL